MPYKCEAGHTEFNPLCAACETEINNITSLKRLRSELGLREDGTLIHTKSGLTGKVVGVNGDNVLVELDVVAKTVEIHKNSLVPSFAPPAPQA